MANSMIKLKIKGMNCGGCAANIERRLTEQEGVEWASVNFATSKAIISCNEELIDESTLSQLIYEMGYSTEAPGLSLREQMVKDRSRRGREERNIWSRFLVSILLSVFTMWVEMTKAFSDESRWYIEMLSILPVWLWGGWPFLVGMVKSFGRAPFSMDTLVGLGTSVAFIYSAFVTLSQYRFVGFDTYVYFEGVGFIVSFILLGRALETRAKAKTSEAMEALLEMSELKPRVVRDGLDEFVELESVGVGEIVWVKPGETVPLDGKIVTGNGMIDESVLTGESEPVLRQEGDSVVGSSINTNGSFRIEVTHRADEGFLSRITQLVEEAQEKKAPIQKLADRVSQIFVPIVMGISLLCFVLWWNFGPDPALGYALVAMVSVLIISCPCALGLATPTAVMVGVGQGSRFGILIRDGLALEESHKVTDVVLDKTGTVTQGRFAVLREELALGVEAEEVYKAVLAIERHSEHPLASTMVSYLVSKGIDESSEAESSELHMGEGIEGVVSGKKVIVGNQGLIERLCSLEIPNSDELLGWQESGFTIIYVAIGGVYAGAFALADEVRSESAAAVASLVKMGLNVWMVTGDHKTAAERVRKEISLNEKFVRSGVKPEGKLEFIEELQKKGAVVAMVGDGVNDAPALARSNVSIAMGMGTDVAIKSAYIGLVHNSLKGVPDSIQLSKSTMKIIRQNLLFSFLYNTLCIPLAAGLFYPLLGWQLSPIFASIAMAMSSVSVVGNSLRLKRWSPQL